MASMTNDLARKWHRLAVIGAIVWAMAGPAGATTNHGLSAIHAITAVRHADVAHIAADDLATAMEKNRDKFLIIDVREPEEFAVSHIPGARRVSPDITAAAFQRRFRGRLSGRNLVLYCSVGVRSTNLASRIRDVVLDAGATSIANLEGGVFAWHNQKRKLVSPDGPTDLIHPYNSFWGTLIDRRDQISYGSSVRRAASDPAAAARP